MSLAPFGSFAGVVPLVLSSGAGAEVRWIMGITVFSGMIGVTLFGLFLTPVFYCVIRGWMERTGRSRAAPLASARATPEVAE